MTPAAMRGWHRWFGLVAAIFMIFLAATGLALQIDLWVTGNPVPGSGTPAPSAPVVLPGDAEIGRLAAAAIVRARAARPTLVIRHIDLAFTPAGVRATAGGIGPYADHVLLDPRSGAIIPERRATPGWHNALQDLHAGYILGTPGRVLSVLLALSLLVLGITGLAIYLDLYRRRWRAGRRALFWRR